MILNVSKLNKSIGAKTLLEDINFTLNKSEKIALIGRNGSGKTTLFKILAGLDNEYQGFVEFLSGTKITLTQQEHSLDDNVTAIDYITRDIPDFLNLQEQISKYELKGQDSDVTLEEYCDAVAVFSEKGYYDIQAEILISLEQFQINEDRAKMPMKDLSGGEKRFVEITRIMYSECDLALIDEPTNHMDYIGKDKFIKWLQKTKESLFLISHDRDVLQNVDRILELRDNKIFSFSGNYDSYIKHNSQSTSSQIKGYELSLHDIDLTKKQMLLARSQKFAAKSDKGRTAALIRETRFQKKLDSLTNNLSKPSFWIDQENLETLDKRTIDSYHKYKDKNIRITNRSEGSNKRLLVKVDKLSIGYKDPLFNNINFDIYSDDKIEIKGRNGAGKSTLVKTLISIIDGNEPKAKMFYGDVIVKNSVRLGIYEQEVQSVFLDKTLGDAVKEIYYDLDLPYNEQIRSAILKQYLFDPLMDWKIMVKDLSGGQKARLQLIKMMANNPTLLILDEPTNHLDLPSIEELENTLKSFNGGIIYISHDSYFTKALGGEVILIERQE